MTPSTQKQLGKTLVLTHPARLGDSVMALPLHRALARETRVESNVGKPYRFFFDLAQIEVAYAGPLYPKGVRALLSEARAMKAKSYGSVFLIRPNFRSALLTKLAKIPIRVGDPTEGRRPLLTHVADVPAKANQLERLQSFAETVGVEVPNDFGIPAYPKSPEPLLGIVPGASYSDKFIPPEALREVAQHYMAQGYRLAFLGGPGEEQWAEPLADIPGERWIGTYSLPDLIEPLSSLWAIVASDGGLYHLSIACGVPSVGVYGPTIHRHWYHNWGPHTAVLAPNGTMSQVTSSMLISALDRSLSLRA